jgi:predicted RNA-binding protein with RPS1 domain
MKVVVVDTFGSFLELEFQGERGCMHVSEVLFEIRPRKHMFCC